MKMDAFCRLGCVGLIYLGSFDAYAASDSSPFTLITGVGVQYKQLNMDQKIDLKSNGNAKGDLTAYMPTLNLHIAGLYGNFFSALKFETNVAKASETSGIPYTNENLPGQTDVSRQDIGLTFGYQLIDSLVLFTGYMKGRTELEPDAYIPAVNPSCLVLGVMSCNVSGLYRQTTGGQYVQTYEEKGPFIGASYSWKLSGGRLAANVAYASMNGEYADNSVISINGNVLFDQSFLFRGKSKGVSLAATWTAPITEELSYFVDLRKQSYQMNASSQAPQAMFIGATAKTNEQLLGVTGGVQYKF